MGRPAVREKLDRGLRVNRAVVQAFVDERHEAYHDAAANRRKSEMSDASAISSRRFT